MFHKVLFSTLIIALLSLTGRAIRNVSVSDIQAIFDGILKIEGIRLDDEEYKERMAVFGLNYLAEENDNLVNIQMMYDYDELDRQNGAKPVRLIESRLQKRLKKRGVDPFDMGAESTPEYFDGRKYRGRRIINEAVHQGVCGNCYLHTFIAALELAYFKGSGELIKFSEQEMTDCYNNGCTGGDFKMVSITMSYIDKVSTRDGYGDFLSKQVTCRANTTPDALMKIKIVDYIDVSVETVEAAILKYGSVMTCMKWGARPEDVCFMSAYKAGDIVDYPEVKKGCDHAVLIVGYTPEYYIVRNSHGKTWGEEGYFRVKRGINSCGIEEDMAAIVIESRFKRKKVSKNGCPPSKPHLCEKINTCTAQSECHASLEDIEAAEEEKKAAERASKQQGMPSHMQGSQSRHGSGSLPANLVHQQGSQNRHGSGSLPANLVHQQGSQSRHGSGSRPSHMHGGSSSSSRKTSTKTSTKTSGSGSMQGLSAAQAAEMAARMARMRGGRKRRDVEMRKTRRVRRGTCTDKSPKCSVIPNVCAAKSPFASACHATCGTCDQIVKKEPKSVEKKGQCLPPYIPHGTVINQNKIMEANEELKVKCEDGYTLVGSTSRCLIQDIFTNDDKDARLLPECIKLGEDKLVGNGTTYQGTKNSYLMHGRWFECDSWNFDVLRGVLMGERKGLDLLLGNHNYCRNPGGMEPVPFCIGSARGLGEVVYCYGHPGCDTCAGAVDDYDAGYCNSQKRFCLYSDKTTRDRVSVIQERCAATCCALGGCSIS